MPPKKSEKTAQQANRDVLPTPASAAAVMTSEQITATLTQLLKIQRQTQQQIEALLARQSNPAVAGRQPGNVVYGREQILTR